MLSVAALHVSALLAIYLAAQVPFFATSSQQGTNVTELLEFVAQAVIQHKLESVNSNVTAPVSLARHSTASEHDGKKKCGC